jgi:hypothetical protein
MKILVIVFILIFILGCVNRPFESNSWIMDKPTIEDEKPKAEYGRSQWWAWYGYAYSENGSELLLNANIYPRDGTLYGNSYTIDGKMETFNFEMV